MLGKILENRKVGTDYYFMKLETQAIDESWLPGRFLHLKLSRKRSHDPLLRRPFSLFDVHREKKIFDLLYCVVGRGTKIMSEFNPGEQIDFIGPLGTGFTKPKGENILVIGGGMGTAPLFYLCRKISRDNQVTVFLGGNDCGDVDFFEKKFKELDLTLKVATIDGSRGFRGNVINLWEKKQGNNNDFDYLFACGPELMLKEVQKKAITKNLPGEFSLEERMGCGIGVCLSCVCETEEGNQRVCQEGPVFKINEVIFDE